MKGGPECEALVTKYLGEDKYCIIYSGGPNIGQGEIGVQRSRLRLAPEKDEIDESVHRVNKNQETSNQETSNQSKNQESGDNENDGESERLKAKTTGFYTLTSIPYALCPNPYTLTLFP